MKSMFGFVLASLVVQSAGEGTCETAWLRGSNSLCFLELAGITRWGWSITVQQGTTEVMPLYAAAGQCKVENGWHVGDATVEFAGTQITVSLAMVDGWVAGVAALHVGETLLHVKKGKLTAAPGQFPYKSEHAPHTFVVDVEEGHQSLYMALHVDVCSGGATPAPTPAPATEEPATPSPQCEDAASTLVRVEQPYLGKDALPVPVVEGMDGWTLAGNTPIILNLYEVQLRQGVHAYFPDQDDALEPGKSLVVHCPANCDNAPCEVTVTVYHCPPCSQGFNGGYPSLLPVHGWAPGRCAPYFQYTRKHNMVGFYKLIPAGTSEVLPATIAKLSNFAVFARTNAVDCDGLKDDGACSAQSECKWEGGECVPEWCPVLPPRSGGQQGPTPCAPCAPTEADA